jgi:hypothetical protein
MVKTIVYIFGYITLMVISASILMHSYPYIWLILAVTGLILLYIIT